MTRGEERSATFILTALTTGCLTESVTRTVSLMRWTPSAIACAVVGVFTLGLLFLQMGLTED